MKFRNKILFIIIYILGISIFLFPNNSLAQYNQDIEYTFNENNLYSDMNNFTNYNLRHSNIITQNYTTTYDFLNDTNYSEPNDWIIVDPTGSILIEPNLDLHNKVMNINDTGASTISATNTLPVSQTSGTIELWFRIIDITKNSRIICWYGCSPSIHFGVDNSRFYYYTGANNYLVVAKNNLWYHIRFDFECGGGSYEGLAPDTFFVYINETKYGAFAFQGVVNLMDSISVYTDTADANYKTYIDAIGYSWNSYTIGNNIIPDIIIENSTILKPDKYEFSLDSDGNPFQDNVQNPSLVGFDNRFGSNIYTDNIGFDLGINVPPSEYGIKVSGHNGAGSGIYNDTIRLYDDMINISFSLRYFDVSELTSHVLLYFESIDGTLIGGFKIDTITGSMATLQYYDNLGVYQDIDDIYGLSNPLILHDFNLYINDFNVDLLYYVNGSYNNSYTFPLIENYKGLSNVELIAFDINVADFIVRFDSFSLYQYNISLCYEAGYLSYSFNDTWNLRNQNLFDFNCTGTSRTLASNKEFIFRFGAIPVSLFNEISAFNTIDYFLNLYNKSAPYEFDNAHLIVMTNINGMDYASINFTIEGLSLSDNLGNTYIPNYSYNNVDKDLSYFYVQENRLYHTLNITHEFLYESMTIFFDIVNIINVNRTIQFNRVYNGFGNAYFQIQYADGLNNTFEYTTSIHNYNFILPQKQLIDNLTFIIDDNNQTSYTNNLNLGWINDITLVWFPEIAYTILILDLLYMFIPLFIILIPSISIRKVFGKNFFLPIMIFLTIIVFAVQLIPLWMFSILLGIYGYLIMINRSENNG